jgi:hypothetical protein
LTPAAFRKEIIEPGAAWLEDLTGIASSTEARRMLLAVAAKESDLKDRAQITNSGIGKARSFWQGELTGGMVTGVMGLYSPSKPSPFPRVTTAAKVLCEAASVRWDRDAVWRAIEGHDRLAYGLARLLLLTDPYTIPTDADTAWARYMRVWRPGVPNQPKWPGSWAKALVEYPRGA